MKHITTEQKLAMMNHYIETGDAHEVAILTGFEYNDIVHTLSAHGYPDRDKVTKAARIVKRTLDREARSLPPAEHDKAERAPGLNEPVAVHSEPRPVVVDSRPPEPSIEVKRAAVIGYQAGRTIEALLDEGKKSTKVLTRRRAEKIESLVEELRNIIREQRREEEESAAAKRAQEAAANEVDRLKRELEAAKAKARALAGNVPPAKLREWAKQNGFDLGERGRISAEVREAYGRAHQGGAA